MAPAPKVTLITSAYNRPKLVDATIRSVLAQDFADFEYILIDDGSTDETPDVLRAHAEADSRIRLSIEPNRGYTTQLKRANAAARGRYVGWVDSDDLLMPSCVRETVEFLDARPDVAMVYTDQIVIDEHNRPLGVGGRATIPYSPERMLRDFMTFHFRLYRREVYDLAGGVDEKFDCAQDYDFCLKVSEVGVIENLPRPLYMHRHHPASVSGSKRLRQIECSAMAVRDALERRGLADRYELDVELVSKFRIRERSTGDSVSTERELHPQPRGDRPPERE